jgi:NTE family protein
MHRPKLGIACQGGGTHTAFTAGVLQHFLAKGVQDTHEIVAFSGTSGGAICALAAWYGLARRARGIDEAPYQVLMDFWRANAAQTPAEILFASFSSLFLAGVEKGKIPTLPPNPYRDEPALEFIKPFFSRREFLDIRALVEAHFDFGEINQLMAGADMRLLLGAVNVLSGRFKAFDSWQPGEINVDALLASTAVPTVFKAVPVQGQLYWDGLFSQNPPVHQLISCPYAQRPEELWVILINQLEIHEEPVSTEAIFERRNALAGNISLSQELYFIETVNRWISQGLFNPAFSDRLKPVRVRLIGIDPAVHEELTYSTKISRDAGLIEQLVAHGQHQAEVFLSGTQNVGV